MDPQTISLILTIVAATGTLWHKLGRIESAVETLGQNQVHIRQRLEATVERLARLEATAR